MITLSLCFLVHGLTFIQRLVTLGSPGPKTTSVQCGREARL